MEKGKILSFPQGEGPGYTLYCGPIDESGQYCIGIRREGKEMEIWLEPADLLPIMRAFTEYLEEKLLEKKG